MSLEHLLNGNSQCDSFQSDFFFCDGYVCMFLDISKEAARGWQNGGATVNNVITSIFVL